MTQPTAYRNRRPTPSQPISTAPPCREDGHLFFRPGGHGALIENLNDLDADVIFIKNIDNVVGDDRRESTIHYKKVLGGTLVAVKQRIDQYCRLLRAGVPRRE